MLKLKTFDTFNVEQVPILTSTSGNFYRTVVLGIHKFYLGYNKEGIILLLVTLISCGMLGFITSIIGLVEGILYLTKSDEEFESTYIIGRRPWF